MELADQSFTHFTGREVEGGQVLVCWGEVDQALIRGINVPTNGSLHVIRGRSHLSLGHFGLEQLRQERRRARSTLLA